MNNQNLIICDFQILYEILNEIEENLNFKLLNISKDKFSEINFDELGNFLIISKKNLNFDDQIIIENYPIELLKLVENINIKFLKKKYNQQSDVSIGDYKLNLNARIIFYKNYSLDLTEKEIQIITFLNDAQKPVKVNQLQSKVWGHNSKLDTHTVETHIYRLRKKISDTFKDDDFIKSSKLGYKIK
tara:strand:+ start:1098 stop:1658 length:561 start_codon:yes stop_codon:yes gene_type:complete